MKKTKIIVTGCMGYLGSELMNYLSGEARYKDIIGIDNRFVSERVKQLRDWGINFIQCSILDKDKLSEILKDADYVYHLAGITDVAYVKTQSNEQQDNLIKETGVTGTRNVINSVSENCKIIFPSTHVVYEGLSEAKFDITEGEPACPVLTYATGKAVSEFDLESYKLHNHIIVRLGSVYGYSTDTMRINIMPNLFSKMASQDSNISLYSGGVQYKSLVNIHDVVRAMVYLGEGDYNGTYHLTNENMTIRQVAEICKKYKPNIQLIDTPDEIPNLGYTLSNSKLLNTGFKFLYNIEDSIKEMITNWSVKDRARDLEYTIRGDKEYVDARGRILNYELPEPINLIGYITSTAGSVRANHYHPIQEQKCLLISGRYISVTKDLSYPNAPLEYKTIRPGDIAVIQPNVAHTMVFLQDSVFLNLVRGEREHSNYGITHTIPYILVDDTHKDTVLANYKHNCRSCGHTDLKEVISLGMSPLANNLTEVPGQPELYPLEMEYCPKCYNCQLSIVVPASEMFDNYLYVSSTSNVFRKHFEDAAIKYIKEFELNEKSLVLDIGSNDGVFLKPLQEQGIRVVGIEPATNICGIANNKDIPTIQGYFTQDTAHQVYLEHGTPDLITASNVFAHADNLKDIANVVFSLLKPDGTFIIEVQYLVDTIRELTFDNIYHEHVNYWCVTSLNNFFTALGYYVNKVEHIDTHGGSIRVYIKRDYYGMDSSVLEYLKSEENMGINSYSTFTTFDSRVQHIKNTVSKNIKLLKDRYNIAAYGSPAKATTALNYFNINNTLINYTIEDNALKIGKYIPGVNIPIFGKDHAYDNLPNIIIVLAWNFLDSIVQNCESLTKKGVKFISIKDLEIDDGMPILDTVTLIGEKSNGKVYDCFIFFDELELLELRLNVMDPVVDYFVIVEASITHSGLSKEFIFEKNKDKFNQFIDKIIYIKVEDMPTNFTNLIPNDDLVWNKIINSLQTSTKFSLTNLPASREQFQRASILRGLINCKDEDVIILSDLDEITNPDTLSYILSNFNPDMVYSMRQTSYYYYLNLLKEYHWVGARLSSYRTFNKYTPTFFRHIRDTIVAGGGWHFSFQGNANEVGHKLQSYSHCDMATNEVLSKLPEHIRQGIDPFGRGKLIKVPIDNTYPKYLLDNIDRYKYMIL